MEITYTVDKVDKLDNILREKLKMSRRVIKECEQDILVNGVHRLRNQLLNIGDVILVSLKEVILEEEKFINKYAKVEEELDILYEDEYLLAVNKPSNMPVHPSCNNYDNTLSNIVAPYLAKQNVFGIHIVTRLDKDTSGVCIFAKHPYIQELFNLKKKDLNIKKEYLCVVKGIIKNQHEIIEQPIKRKENSIILREVNNEGQYAKTEYFVEKLNKKDNFSILKVLLHTGRTHQIRVHMSYIGHPLLGDDLYEKETEKENILKLIQRQALHCNKIKFTHPITGNKICIISNLPQDIKTLIEDKNCIFVAK
ncbi:MAG: RluA family pseudouridine synthase [Clostridia bacterium]|nr:RluA family pseudouridine synthase [Clostridia bacterium]